ncbi:RTA1 like protein [Colletotrichum graminicola]|uniref:RTA1 like protein n=1 Tax=Colletotrichum graminicola (strain M1.001 / M2 / FGSC 10212) TaxID=645133 RepID=E3Q811_COLGM|nr:RTA1 like protein [Colletotrichum graminicola M1.001]EFQ27023.1 RTA1 like protein [Colletotrichum graminicola M1.001]WDK16754.1 RTA1 like protein [Colletotrichum graminicola]
MSGPSPPLPSNLVVFGPDANCTLDLCPLEYSLYQYRPNLAVNILFLALFALAAVVHIGLGIRWRTWGFMAFMIAGCFSEIIGYVGRIIMYYNPFQFAGFMLQIIFITCGPVYYTAAIYVTIGRAIDSFAPELSRIPTKVMYWLFISCDVFCLVLQAAGGALSTTSAGSSDVGVDLAMAGLVLQVIVLVAFCALFADYMARYTRSAAARPLTRRDKLFFGFLALAIVLILARCAYRVDELSDGYNQSEKLTNEGLFIGLEGVLIICAVFALCIGHPGMVFGRRKVSDGVRKGSSAESGMESGTSQMEQK